MKVPAGDVTVLPYRGLLVSKFREEPKDPGRRFGERVRGFLSVATVYAGRNNERACAKLGARVGR